MLQNTLGTSDVPSVVWLPNVPPNCCGKSDVPNVFGVMCVRDVNGSHKCDGLDLEASFAIASPGVVGAPVCTSEM